MPDNNQSTGHAIAYPLAGSKAKRLKKLELPISDTTLRTTYRYGSPDVTVIIDSLANIPGASLQEAPGGDSVVLNLGDFKIIVENDDTSAWERGRGVTLAILEGASITGSSKIELPADHTRSLNSFIPRISSQVQLEPTTFPSLRVVALPVTLRLRAVSIVTCLLPVTPMSNVPVLTVQTSF